MQDIYNMQVSNSDKFRQFFYLFGKKKIVIIFFHFRQDLFNMYFHLIT